MLKKNQVLRDIIYRMLALFQWQLSFCLADYRLLFLSPSHPLFLAPRKLTLGLGWWGLETSFYWRESCSVESGGMPETLSFLQWNSVGFYLPENFSRSLVFCSAKPRVREGAGFCSGPRTWTAGRSRCVAGGAGPRLLRADGRPVIGGRVRGVCLTHASEQFLGSDCCCRIPCLLLLWLKCVDTKCNFLILLWHVFRNALLVIDCETGRRKCEGNLKRWSSFQAFLSLRLHKRIIQRWSVLPKRLKCKYAVTGFRDNFKLLVWVI